MLLLHSIRFHKRCLLPVVFVLNFLISAFNLSWAQYPSTSTGLFTTEPTTSMVAARQNESFTSLSMRIYGSYAFATELAVINNLPANAVFEEGQMITLPQAASKSTRGFTVIYAKGDARYKHQENSQWNPLSMGVQKLTLADELITGPDGFVSLQLSTGDVVNIQPGTRVTLNDVWCRTRVATDIHSDHLPRMPLSNPACSEQPPGNFRIITPYASAAVRG